MHHHTDELLKQIESTLETLKTVKEMVLQNQSCIDVLNQINGVSIRLTDCRTTVINDHINSCLPEALKPNNEHVASDVRTIIKLISQNSNSGSFH